MSTARTTKGRDSAVTVTCKPLPSEPQLQQLTQHASAAPPPGSAPGAQGTRGEAGGTGEGAGEPEGAVWYHFIYSSTHPRN